MKIGKLHIYWERENESVRRYEKRLSKVDDERLNKYISGGYHLHKNPKRKLLQNLPPPKKEEKENESHAALPRYTPEELNRLIDRVRKAESPEPLYNLAPPKEGE